MKGKIFLLLSITAFITFFGYYCFADSECREDSRCKEDSICRVETTSVNFGNYNVLSVRPLDSNGRITVVCTSEATVSIGIGPSLYSEGFSPRKMRMGTKEEFLTYNLYTDSSRTIIWGDSTNDTKTVNIRTRKHKHVVNTVYGRIPPLQNAEAGHYEDALMVTITW